MRGVPVKPDSLACVLAVCVFLIGWQIAKDAFFALADREVRRGRPGPGVPAYVSATVVLAVAIVAAIAVLVSGV